MRGRWLGSILLYLTLLLFVVVTLLPIYWIVLSAVTPGEQLFRVPLSYWPQQFSLRSLTMLADSLSLHAQLFNTALISTCAAALTVGLCLPAAYAFARLSFPGRQLLFLGLVLSGFLPAASTIIALFQMVQSAGLIDTKIGLIVLYVNLLLPTSVWLLAGYVRQVPYDLEEAAQVDGAGFLRILGTVVAPLLRPALATLFLLDLITAWDEYLTPLIFNRTDATITVTLGVSAASGNWSSLATMGLLAILPVFVLALAFQKQIMDGLMAGALKG